MTTIAISNSQWHSSSDLRDGSSAKQEAPAAQIAGRRPEAQMTDEERQKIYNFRIPQFASPEYTCSYISQINPHLATASKEAYQWLQQHRIDTLFHPGVFNKFCSVNLPEIAGRTFPDAGPQGMAYAAKFAIWIYSLDDLMDDTAFGMSPESSLSVFVELHLVLMWNFPEDSELYENLISFVEACPNSKLKKASLEIIDTELSRAKRFPGTVYDGKLSPLASSLRELWATLVETGSELSSLRMAKCLQRYFVGNLNEAKNREDEKIPTVEEYILIRRGSGAMDPYLMLADPVYKVQPSEDIWNTPQMRELLKATNDNSCWHNDLWSFQKEVSRGDRHNLVWVISNERKCSYAEAALIIRDMLDRRLVDLRKAAVDLQAIVGPADQHAVSMHIKHCLRWPAATDAFHRKRATTRFEMADSLN